MQPATTVSVIIPLFNARSVVAETVESVLAQTWKHVDIIVVDDGSTDGSSEALRRFGGAIRYIIQQNAGVARARNRGIQEAKGQYIAFLDHDDLWHPAKIEKQVMVLDQQQQCGMVITDVAHIDHAGRPMGIIGTGYNPTETFARLFVGGYVPTPSAVMIRRSVFETVGGFDDAFRSAGLDDHELWTRIAAHYEIANIPEPLTYHRNLTVKPPRIAIEHRHLLFTKLMERFGDDQAKRRYLWKELALYFADHGKQLINEGNYREGRAQLIKGLALSVRQALGLKIACRCVSRLARSYVR